MPALDTANPIDDQPRVSVKGVVAELVDIGLTWHPPNRAHVVVGRSRQPKGNARPARNVLLDQRAERFRQAEILHEVEARNARCRYVVLQLIRPRLQSSLDAQPSEEIGPLLSELSPEHCAGGLRDPSCTHFVDVLRTYWRKFKEPLQLVAECPVWPSRREDGLRGSNELAIHGRDKQSIGGGKRNGPLDGDGTAPDGECPAKTCCSDLLRRVPFDDLRDPREQSLALKRCR